MSALVIDLQPYLPEPRGYRVGDLVCLDADRCDFVVADIVVAVDGAPLLGLAEPGGPPDDRIWVRATRCRHPAPR